MRRQHIELWVWFVKVSMQLVQKLLNSFTTYQKGSESDTFKQNFTVYYICKTKWNSNTKSTVFLLFIICFIFFTDNFNQNLIKFQIKISHKIGWFQGWNEREMNGEIHTMFTPDFEKMSIISYTLQNFKLKKETTLHISAFLRVETNCNVKREWKIKQRLTSMISHTKRWWGRERWTKPSLKFTQFLDFFPWETQRFPTTEKYCHKKCEIHKKLSMIVYDCVRLMKNRSKENLGMLSGALRRTEVTSCVFSSYQNLIPRTI